MFCNEELINAFTVETLQKQFGLQGINKTVREILGYVVLAKNSYNTDWTIYAIKTAEDGDTAVFVEDEDELLVSTDYRELFSHYHNQAGAEVYMERLGKYLVHYGLIEN